MATNRVLLVSAATDLVRLVSLSINRLPLVVATISFTDDSHKVANVKISILFIFYYRATCTGLFIINLFSGCYDGNVYSVDVACGSIMWRLRTEAMVKGIPFLIDDTWIFGSYDYHVYCVKVWVRYVYYQYGVCHFLASAVFIKTLKYVK